MNEAEWTEMYHTTQESQYLQVHLLQFDRDHLSYDVECSLAGAETRASYLKIEMTKSADTTANDRGGAVWMAS
jgi:hypothetical protein